MSGIQREESAGFDRSTIDYIQRAAATGLYEIRGLGAKRRVPSFDDLLFLAASLSRYPLEGYRERCATKTVLGTRFASRHCRRGSRRRSAAPRPRRAPRPRPAMVA
jgi:methylamine---glutamate N-methyltransferase subunit C